MKFTWKKNKKDDKDDVILPKIELPINITKEKKEREEFESRLEQFEFFVNKYWHHSFSCFPTKIKRNELLLNLKKQKFLKSLRQKVVEVNVGSCTGKSLQLFNFVLSVLDKRILELDDIISQG